jgi:protein subunit release factor A
MHNTPQPLKIQQEMVDDNKPLSETGAGLFVDAEIKKLRREHEETLASIKKEMELALQKKDVEMQKMLDDEMERSKKEIEDLCEEQEIEPITSKR